MLWFIWLPWLHVKAMTIWLWVVYTGAELHKIVKNHEAIHSRQWSEMLVIGFLPVYGWDFLHGLIKYRVELQADGKTSLKKRLGRWYDTAYRSIRMEQEAYEKEAMPDWPDIRPAYYWLNYKV